MANQYYLTAGIAPIDGSEGATANTYYIAAGIIPLDVAGTSNPLSVTGDMTPEGALLRKIDTAKTGSITPVGSIAKEIQLLL